MLNVTPVLICNLALDELPAAGILSLGDKSPEARACARQYPVASEELLGAGFPWGFATVRAELASLASNDRPGEWTSAYAAPGDMLLPARLLSDIQDDGRYEYTGQTVYANGSRAVLEYVSTAVTPEQFTPLFRKALVLLLASKICMPIKKDRTQRKELGAEAYDALMMAAAEAARRSPISYGDHVPDVLLARMGYEPGYALPPMVVEATGGEQIPDTDYAALFEAGLDF